ncbi:conserved hypothetical protein [Beggiatoa sp. PS]|nr:conserved hypothetical protein [Beggiatoa sp. PS]
MVIDTSALIAILLREPEAEKFAKAIISNRKRLLSAFSALETGVVIEARKGNPGKQELDLLLSYTKIDIVALNDEQVQMAMEAWRKFGKGHHPAKLNLGDCCSYALAKYFDEPLLFKGNDFNQTDIKIVQLT